MIDTSIGKFSKKDFIKKANEGTLPENLITISLDLYGCTSLKTLPSDMEVEGYLDLKGCSSLTSLPEGLKVRGDLFLNGCTSLTALPSDMKVGISLSVDESFIQNYPFKDLPKILHLPFYVDIKQLLLERLK
jgi:hypothetical protein